VISGTATAIICRTGAKTALGKLAANLREKPPATAFALGIRGFGMLIMRFTVFLVLFVLVVNIWFDRAVLESLMFALALAVGLTPELLPMIVTVTLARSALALAKRKVIVKRLSAIHDLGAMDVLCTDKTGTLTEATIRLVGVVDGGGAESERAYALAYINSRFESGMKSPLDEAILAARPFDMDGWKKIDEVPFDFERRRVSVLVDSGAERRLIVKGAPEDLLRSRLDTRRRRARSTRWITRRVAPSRRHLKHSARRGSERWVLPAAWLVRVMRPPRLTTSATSFSPASPFFLIRRRLARGARSRGWQPPGSP
jgi:Mg2+-importing ATPase